MPQARPGPLVRPSLAIGRFLSPLALTEYCGELQTRSGGNGWKGGLSIYPNVENFFLLRAFFPPKAGSP